MFFNSHFSSEIFKRLRNIQVHAGAKHAVQLEKGLLEIRATLDDFIYELQEDQADDDEPINKD